MALFNKFYSDKLSVRYFPDQKVIYLEPQKGLTPTKLRGFKEKIETYLDVESSNFNKIKGKPTFSIKLNPESQESSIEELLKQMFHGGDAVEDPSTIASFEDAEEEDEEKVTADDVQGQESPAPPQQESYFAFKYYNSLLESTYRTGEYWNRLSKVMGVGSKQKINPDDVLNARKTWTNKPNNKKRNSVLRDLDQAMRYFARRLKKDMGPGAGELFKKKYREIGNLTPSDYKDDQNKHLDSKINSDTSGVSPPAEPSEEPVNLDFSEFFSDKEDEDEKEEDYYEDFDTKE